MLKVQTRCEAHCEDLLPLWHHGCDRQRILLTPNLRCQTGTATVRCVNELWNVLGVWSRCVPCTLNGTPRVTLALLSRLGCDSSSCITSAINVDMQLAGLAKMVAANQKINKQSPYHRRTGQLSYTRTNRHTKSPTSQAPFDSGTCSSHKPTQHSTARMVWMRPG
jgi:hypothetical protein